MYSLFYARKKNNAGDYYSRWILEKLGIETEYKGKNVDILGVGSILDRPEHTDGHTLVWGSGFHNWKDNETTNIDNNNNFILVRGYKTLEKLRELGFTTTPAVGDPGLLLGRFYQPKIQKKYKVGVISSHQNYDKLKEMLDKIESPYVAPLIDIRTGIEIENLADKIAECEFIISSSLHGIIFAHSLGIPAVHLLDEEILESRGCFKYKDYYSVLDIDYNNESLSKGLDVIITKYLIGYDTVKYLPSELCRVSVQNNILLSVNHLKLRLEKPAYQNVVCAIAKNEHLYINEWVSHYVKLGFDQIFLFDNDDLDYDFVGNYIKPEYYPYVTIFNKRNVHKEKLQTACYEWFYKRYNKRFKWCLFCDIDEFLDGIKNIKDLTSSKNIPAGVQQIRIKWRLFGDDNLIERDVTQPVFGFFKQQKYTSLNRDLNKPGKLQLQGKFILRNNIENIHITSPHFASKGIRSDIVPSCLPSGKKTSAMVEINDDYSKETIYINHYMTKTLKEFIDQKFGRGDACFSKRDINLDYYWRINTKTIEKLHWLKQNKYIDRL